KDSLIFRETNVLANSLRRRWSVHPMLLLWFIPRGKSAIGNSTTKPIGWRSICGLLSQAGSSFRPRHATPDEPGQRAASLQQYRFLSSHTGAAMGSHN